MARPAHADRRRRGRPARLSRAAILDAAQGLLERSPREPLTIARIAAEVDAVPAALYRHFASLDDLLDSVLGRVLGSAPLEIRRRAGWQEQVRDWMSSLRAHLLRYPAVLSLIGRRGRTSPRWLDAVAELIAILERGGLRGAQLARAHLWIAETTIGLAMQEAPLSLPEQIEGARASLAEMSEAGRGRLAPLVPHLTRLDGDTFFEFVADRTIAALTELAAGR
ncbi:MAG TPA: TetR/AcrR family transcriptional regulator C-terminal domain-containing protein [Myxococcota bacterium]|nr:TetR/AcrR family transcriptional regulator C-terminal domain-containing protein [Myxococcota bacterium]